MACNKQKILRNRLTHPIAYECILGYIYIFFLWRCDPMRDMASSFLRFLDHTQRRTTVGRTPLN